LPGEFVRIPFTAVLNFFQQKPPGKFIECRKFSRGVFGIAHEL
jgi:hypothetical protein